MTARLSKQCGQLVEPSRPISKAERAARALAKLESEQESRQSEAKSWLIWLRDRRNCDQSYWSLVLNCQSQLAAKYVPEPRRQLIHDVILIAIFAVLVFGALHNAVDHLLASTSVSAACLASTVFVPVTETVTITAPASDSMASCVLSGSTVVDPFVPSTTTVFLTDTVFLAPSDAPGFSSAPTSSSLAGISQPSPTGVASFTAEVSASLDTVVSAAEFSYAPSSSLDALPGDAGESVATITSPVYTETSFQIEPTTTMTSTHYITYTVYYASHSMFDGLGSSGWNATGSASVTKAQTSSPALYDYTILQSPYWTLGSSTRSTITITTTISTMTLTLTTWIPWPSASANGSLRRQTLTGASTLSTAFSNSSSILVKASDASTATADAIQPYSQLGSPSSSAVSISSPNAAALSTPLPSLLSLAGNSNSLSDPQSSTAVIAPSSVAKSPLQSSSTLVSGTLGQNSKRSSFLGNTPANAQTSLSPAAFSTSASMLSSLVSSLLSSLAHATLTTSASSGIVVSAIPATTDTKDASRISSVFAISSSSPAGPVSVASFATSSSYQTSSSLMTDSLGSSSQSSDSVTANPPETSNTTAPNSSPSSGYSTTETTSFSASASSTSLTLLTSDLSSNRLASSSGTFNVSSSASTLFATASPSNSATTSTFSNPFPPSSATAVPTSCGESGDFVITFDNLPSFNPTNGISNITQAPPVFSPYNHFTFSNGYVYAPSSLEPYIPASYPNVAVFLPNNTGMRSSGNTMFTKPGEFGDGPYEALSAFWFDAYNASVGCDNAGPENCTLVLTGYTWDANTSTEVASYNQNASVMPCPDMQGCQLQLLDFPEEFANLSGIQIQAYVDNEERMFYVDDVGLDWSNNTCAAGLLRQSSR